MKRKLIIDTDPGVDDALALMLAIKSGLFDIAAITTVCGNGTIEAVTRNAGYILEHLGHPDIPLYSGATQPLSRPLHTSVVHGESFLGNVQPQGTAHLSGDAVEKIVEMIAANPDEVTLVALGPLTNIAHAILKEPQTMQRIQEIVIMGGAIREPGNMNRVAEFNFFVDPEAADTVFRFPVQKTLVPLDACNQVRLSLADFDAIPNTTVRDLVVAMAAPYIENIAREEGIEAAPLYDPLTVFYLISPESCILERYHVAIETEGDLTRGMSVADRRPHPEAPPNTGVVMWVDETIFRTRFMHILSR